MEKIMNSIKEYNTNGMNLAEREDLLKNVAPIPIGETVWYAGDCWEHPSLVTVTVGNQREISMFWNSLYFDDEESAVTKNNIARSKYASWQANVWR